MHNSSSQDFEQILLFFYSRQKIPVLMSPVPPEYSFFGNYRKQIFIFLYTFQFWNSKLNITSKLEVPIDKKNFPRRFFLNRHCFLLDGILRNVPCNFSIIFSDLYRISLGKLLKNYRVHSEKLYGINYTTLSFKIYPIQKNVVNICQMLPFIICFCTACQWYKKHISRDIQYNWYFY